jgi:hypothetical protein
LGSMASLRSEHEQGQFALGRAVLHQRVHAESFGPSDLAVFLPDNNAASSVGGFTSL